METKVKRMGREKILPKFCPLCGEKAKKIGKRGGCKDPGTYLNPSDDVAIYRCPKKCIAWYMRENYPYPEQEELFFITTPSWINPIEATFYKRWITYKDKLVLILKESGSGLYVIAKLKTMPATDLKIMSFSCMNDTTKEIKGVGKNKVQIKVGVERPSDIANKVIQHYSYDTVVILNIETGEFKSRVENHERGKEYYR